MLKPITVFVVRGQSESGDNYLKIFTEPPTEKQLSELVHSWDGDDVKEGSGYDGSYVHIDMLVSTVDQDIPLDK